ncbi:MAG TPA: ABC transporter permease [Actinomycetota bacterium]|nr:ABC transporter permease [Actinomycetota bacterium]
MTRSLAAKELKVLWASPLPYVLGAVFHVALGLLGYEQMSGRGQAVFQPIVPVAGFLILLVAPVLTARVLSEEIRSGSLELLLVAAAPPGRIVAGKYLAVVVSLVGLVAPVAAFAFLLFLYGSPDPGPVLTGLLGLVVMAAGLGAVGLLASSLTSSQPLAALGALFSTLLLWFAHAGSDALDANALVAAFSISERLRSFAGGVIDLSDLVFFPSVAGVCLAASVVAVGARRMR